MTEPRLSLGHVALLAVSFGRAVPIAAFSARQASSASPAAVAVSARQTPSASPATVAVSVRQTPSVSRGTVAVSKRQTPSTSRPNFFNAHWGPLSPPPYHHPGKDPMPWEQAANKGLEANYTAYWRSLPKYAKVSPLVQHVQQAPYFRPPYWRQTLDPIRTLGGQGELVFVYNHKTGENLHRNIMRSFPKGLLKFTELHEPPPWRPLPASSKTLHLIRDPVDVIVSGYRYHQWRWGGEMWSWGGRNIKQDPPCFHCDDADHAVIFDTCHFNCTYFELLNRVDETTGAVLEAVSARQTLQIMAGNMARWSGQQANVLQLSMDIFKANFSGTSACLLKFLGLEGRADILQSLTLSVQTIKDPDHVTSGYYNNSFVRSFLQHHPVWGPTFQEVQGMMASIFKRQANLYGCPEHEA